MIKKQIFYVFLVLFLRFAAPINAQCGDGLPHTINLIVLMNQKFINQFGGGNAEVARQDAISKAQAGAAVLNTALSTTAFSDLSFRVVFAPIAPVPSINAGGNEDFLNKVKNFYDNAFPCIPGTVLFFCPGDLTGGNYAVYGGGICGYSSGFESNSIAHEICHTVFEFDHANIDPACSGSAPCTGNSVTDNFMCAAAGPAVALLPCHLTQLGLKFSPGSNLCGSTLGLIPQEPLLDQPNFTCPPDPTMSFSTTVKSLIRGCNNDRSNPMYTITVVGGTSKKIESRIRVEYNINGFQYILADNPEFNGNATTNDPKTNRLSRLDASGNEIIFDLNIGEQKTFMFKLKYDPADTTPLAFNAALKPVAILTFKDDITGAVGFVTKSIQQKKFIAISGVNPSFFANEPLIINSDVKFTEDKFFSAPDILVKKGAQIWFENKAANFITTQTTIEGCGAMWKGIKSTNATITMDNEVIKDAQVGIRLEGGSTGTISGTTFDNNNIGIEIPDKGVAAAANVALSANKFFFTRSAFKPSYSTAQDPPPFERSYAGIQMVNQNAFSLTDAGGQTMFMNQRNGIIANNSNLSINGCNFKSIVHSPGSPFAVGKCISSTGGSLSAARNMIENSDIGIYAIASQLKLRSNVADKVVSGVISELCNNIEIKENNIKAKDFGILTTFANPLYGETMVSGNVITLTGNNDGVAIRSGGSFLMGNNTGYKINGNFVSLLQGRSGIEMGETVDSEIALNSISIAGAGEERYGIRLEGGNNLNVSENNISGSGTADGLAQRGIYGIHPNRSTFRCNYTNNTTYGLNFAGTCVGKNALNINTNTMVSHNNGLLLGLPGNGNAVVGEQTHRGNLWTGSYGDAGARFTGDPLASVASLFRVDNIANTNYLPDFVNPTGWFIDQNAQGNTLICTPAGLVSNEETSAHDIRITQGQIVGINDGGLMEWMAKRRLYERVTEESAFTPNTPSLTTFMGQATTGQVGAFGNIPVQIRQAMAVPASTQTTLANYGNTSLTYQTSIADVDRQIIATKDSATLVGLFAQRSTILQSAGQTMQAIQTTVNALSASRQTALNAVGTQINALNPTTIYQTNEKTVQDIWVTTVGAGSVALSDIQTSTLQSIAIQCPLIGGDAVLKARLLLQASSTTPLFFSDDKACAGAGGRNSANTGGIFASPFTVVPNPANDMVTIQYDAAAGNPSLILSVRNSVGQLVTSQIIPPSDTVTPINVSNWPEGLYFFQMNGGTAQKVVVQHK
jgi:hypothetical protein